MLLEFNLFGKDIKLGKSKEIEQPQQEQPPTKEARLSYRRYDYFDGEKNLGEVGPVKDYELDVDVLRARSWQLYLESEICQMGINRFARWVIGRGLTLQAIPETDVLQSEGIRLDSEKFNAQTESRFKVYSDSKIADFSDMKSLNELAHTAYVNSIVGGDVLVILRLVNGIVKVQLIDSCHISNPTDVGVSPTGDVLYRGNILRNGVELDKNGKQIAYHVQYTPFEWRRIPARNAKTGQIMAFLVYGLDFRMDGTRGMPILSSVIETAKKLERYKEAAVGGAEERQKIPYFIEHGVNSTNENPLNKGLAKIKDFNPNRDDVPVDELGNQLASEVYATTNKMTFNMPNDSTIKSLGVSQEMSFKEFYNTVSDDVFSTIGIPPNVARMLYDSNFSASRAALKDWEHTLEVTRARFYRMFYAPIYALWLDTEILKNKIQAQGYISALMRRDEMVLAAYRSADWTGDNVPHIDPEKEVRAERLKLGAKFDNVPLTTVEAATMAINGGDSVNNMEQAEKEYNKSKLFQADEQQNNNNPPDTPQD